jgi:dsDNA-specific endonuclease/ATPase MutS2
MGMWERLKQALGARADEGDAAEDEDPFAGETDFPVTDELDLHGLPPKMVREIVEAYLEEARRLGYRDVRIVHGKGIGAQREHVRTILARTPFVEGFGDAPADRGGWGATIARLRPL